MTTITWCRQTISAAGMVAIALIMGAAREAPEYVERGEASWYGPGFHGRKTASGERFDQQKLTAAHMELPLGTKAIVTNLENGRSVEVEINDRGPYVPGRAIDLSKAAAREIGMIEAGVAPVLVEVDRIEFAQSASP